mmetsp:Transcript_12977/g.37610  ORF Transcript_12977/g.37610 Transcript_12977/m.37610 type:complete len:131 (-) Transcript_12977:397-789(-)
MQMYGPTMMFVLASCLILADPTCHVLGDHGYLANASMFIPNCPIRRYQSPNKRSCHQSSDCGAYRCGGSNSYADEHGQDCYTCYGDTNVCSKGKETFGCLSTIGWIITVGCTYLGFGQWKRLHGDSSTSE